MPDGSEPVAVKVLQSIRDIRADEWDACAGPDDPFTVSVAGTTLRSRLDGDDFFLFSFPGPWQEFVDPVVGRFA